MGAYNDDNDDEVQRRIDAHEMFLASPGADYLFEGHGE